MPQEVIEITEREIEIIEVIERGPAGPAGPAGSSGTGSETLTTQGDTLYHGAATLERLPIGLAGQFYRVNPTATAPKWDTFISSDISDSTSAGRALLTAANAQAQRDALDVFVGVADFASLPASGVTVSQGGSVYVTLNNGRVYIWNGSSYVEISPFPPVEIIIACSDETSNLTVGTNKVIFRAPCAFFLTGVRASVNTAPTGSPLVVDINENGTSVLSTKLSIDTNEKTSTTAASAAVISDSSIADDAEIAIDIDQIGSTIAGKGLKVVLIGTRV